MQNKTVDPHSSSIGGLDANVMALLAYLISAVALFIPGLKYFSWVIPMVIYFIETQSDYVKFHAIQSLVLYAIGAIISFVVSVIIGGIAIAAFYNPLAVLGVSGLFVLIGSAISIAILVFAILAMVNAYKYVEYHIPFIGPVITKIESLIGRK